jgi:menaquinol-cytochrome c reductase iron-sulfur subunit
MKETVLGETPEEKELSRRNFLSIATLVIGGLISAALGIPAIAYIIGPVLKLNNTQQWIQLGSTAKIELGTPTLFKAKIERQTGWITNEEEISAYALTENGRDFIALSNICTHLGCRVRWVADQGKFFCPCHNGVYDKDGKVVSGPPPRALDHYEVKIENNQLFIKGS